jgi:ELWxxDGT repeat protein
LTGCLGKIYFLHSAGQHTSLWSSDGTEAGTQLVTDISYLEKYGVQSLPIEFKSKLFFKANDGVNGTELWVSDGTMSGTSLFLDINKIEGKSSSPASLAGQPHEKQFTMNKIG